MNVMQIIGRVTADAQVHTLKDDKKVVNFTVAENHDYKNRQTGEWVKRTTFYRCAYWVTDKIAKALTKGRLVALSGRVSTSVWTDMQGEFRVNLDFTTDQIKFHDNGKQQMAKTPNQDITANNLISSEKQEVDLPF